MTKIIVASLFLALSLSSNYICAVVFAADEQTTTTISSTLRGGGSTRSIVSSKTINNNANNEIAPATNANTYRSLLFGDSATQLYLGGNHDHKLGNVVVPSSNKSHNRKKIPISGAGPVPIVVVPIAPRVPDPVKE
jgi:hypothetical protein